MTNCLYCKKPLILMIDAKNSEFKCKNCEKDYELLFKNKILTIKKDNKKLCFFLNDLSNCDDFFSQKNIYDMYNKGYVNCVKILNSKYIQSDNFWELSISKLKDKLKKNIELKIQKELNMEDCFFCKKCNSKYSNQEALINNFSCIICNLNVETYDNSKKINSLNTLLNNVINTNNFKI